jgi:hypothetical protein
MEGEVGVCDDNTFARLLSAVKPILSACGSGPKIIVPPLPRYLYTGCCANKKHCTNITSEDYELTLLHSTMHFRPIIKDSLLASGFENFFVLDGIGALLGIPAGNNRGSAAENLLELAKYCAPDGVHFKDIGYANMAKVIVSAATGLQSGTLTKSQAGSGTLSGRNKSVFFWRGFTSPNGYCGPRSTPVNMTAPPSNSNSMSLPPPAWEPRNTDTQPLPNFVRGGTRGGPHRGTKQWYGGGRRLPYWKKK